MEKVIFDTNILRNTEPKTFLGGRDELKKFSKIAEIVFPDIVIEELKHQKRRQLEKHKKTFLENPFHWLRNINQQDTESFDNEAHINELEKNEDIEYSVIKLQDNSALEQIKELALKKLPPFEEGENTDKGFKDAYAYFTILEYLQVISDKYVFVYTKDGRFKEALQRHQNIKVVKDFEEFREKSISSFSDEYFLSKLNEAINKDIKKENIVDFWLSINGNHILLVDIEDEEIVIEVEKREVISWISTSIYSDSLQSFISSNSFKNTHSIIKFINQYSKYYSDSDILNLFESLLNNVYVKGAIGYGTAVKDFFASLYEAKKEMLEVELREDLKSLIF